MGRAITWLVPLIAAMAVPVSAHASTVHLERGTGYDIKSGQYPIDTLVYQAGAGEVNVVNVNPRGDDFELSDAVPVSAGKGCSAGDVPTTVICHPRGLVAARFALGDGADRLERAPSVRDTTATGGPGDDLLDLRGGGGGWLDGGEGDDDIRASGGGSSMHGGPGADRFVGGAGSGDLVTYRDSVAPVQVTFDGLANDGEADERDNVVSYVENIVGGSGNDVLMGTDGNEGVAGGAGDDLVMGGGGNDDLDGGAGADTLAGGPGDDRLWGYTGAYIPGTSLAYGDDDAPLSTAGEGPDGPGTLAGGPGDDGVRGGPAADAIDPGPGADHVGGSGGGDGISVADGWPDLVTCARRVAAGSAQLDDRDLARRCASVERAGAGAPRILLLGQSDLDRDGVIQVGIACSQDHPLGCPGTLRVSRKGRTLFARRVTIAAGSARLFKPLVHLEGVFEGRRCRRKVVRVSLAARDTAGEPRAVSRRLAVGSTGLDCNFPTLLIAGSGIGW